MYVLDKKYYIKKLSTESNGRSFDGFCSNSNRRDYIEIVSI